MPRLWRWRSVKHSIRRALVEEVIPFAPERDAQPNQCGQTWEVFAAFNALNIPCAYPFVIWKLGLVKGGVVMALLSLATCLLTLWFYDWSKRDWLGIEAVKELRDGEAKSRWRRLLAWTLAKGDLPACVALSLYTDPFITTACLRRGAFNGMTRRDWKIFFASWFIANGWWALACFGGVEALTRLWRWVHGG